MLEEKKIEPLKSERIKHPVKYFFSKLWWSKLTAILRPKSKNFLNLSELEKDPKMLVINQNKPALADCIALSETLQTLVQNVRKELDPYRSDSFDLALLGASTYLYHIDRLIVKMKEHYLSFRYYEEQYAYVTAFHKEMRGVKEICLRCHPIMLNLITLIKSLPRKSLYSDEFITQIHALELEVSALGGTLHSLNQTAYRQEAVLQISQLEQSLLQSFQLASRENLSLTHLSETGTENFYSTTDYLRAKLTTLPYPEHFKLLNTLIDIQEMLRKCYVVSRKSVINDTLDNMVENIESLISALSKEKPAEAIVYERLIHIFNDIESLRFSANRESRCSRNLFEKSKVARRELRKACLPHTLGHAVLKQIEVKRTSLLKKRM